MKKQTVIYAITISVLGLASGVYLCWRFFSGFAAADTLKALVLALLLVLCRSLPLDVSDETTIDMSFISILMIFMTEGYVAAGALYLLTTPLVFVPVSGHKGEFTSMYNTQPIKTCFNVSNIMLTIVGSGLIFTALGGYPGNTALPGCLLPILGYIVVSMVINTLLMSFLLYFEMDMPIKSTLISGFMQFVPNILCAAPIGYFLARLYQFNDGLYLVLLFVLPLLLARYSFKNYLEVKHQQYVLINALSASIEAKDRYTVGHSKRVEQYSAMIAQQMHLSANHIYTIRIEALFHDIGKIGINDTILNKPAKLDAQERSLIEQHPVISAKIIKDIDFYGDIQNTILHHHERYDGQGYPDHIKGDAIPLDAAIIAVADAFDAMTSDRPYRKGFSIDKAVDIVKQESGHQFDPKPAAALVTLYEKGALTPRDQQ